MVQITLLEVDLTDAEFNAPFARESGGELLGDEPTRGLQRVVGQVARSRGGGSGEGSSDRDAYEDDSGTPGRGMGMVGAFLALVVLGWLARRARRMRREEPPEVVA